MTNRSHYVNIEEISILQGRTRMEKQYDLLNEERIAETSMRLEAGYRVLKIRPNTTMHQYQSGVVGFDYDKTIYNKYYIVGYEWAGAKYYTKTDSKSTGGGFGTQVIGASGVVTGSGRKAETERQIEENTLAFMDLQSAETGEVQKISFYCNSQIDARIRCMKLFELQDKEIVKNKFSELLASRESEKQEDIEKEKQEQEKRRLEIERKQKEKEERKREREQKRNSVETQKEKKNPFAIAGLVLGIIGIVTACVFIGIIPGILGLIFSIIALKQANNSNGMAIAGTICSSVSIFIFLFMIMLAILGSNEDIQQKTESNQSSIVCESFLL